MPRKSQSVKKKQYITVSIPTDLAEEIDKLIETNPGYISRQEFIIDAIRRRIEELIKLECKK
ncbi:ribbon-helix-helix domain-containing protein (plasmid) [Sulfolobus tengchongensis]|uniref:Ribbon-helix-helix domain-containing protein n=1 Tax=Sulfolobus tengchongensis TaxID=207809 RepID=A0AAX4L598_9CREN